MSSSSVSDSFDSITVSPCAEQRWAATVVGILAGLVTGLVAMAIFIGLCWAMMPSSRIDAFDSTMLPVPGEFVATKLDSEASRHNLSLVLSWTLA
jgi:hypothetical protein